MNLVDQWLFLVRLNKVAFRECDGCSKRQKDLRMSAKKL